MSKRSAGIDHRAGASFTAIVDYDSARPRLIDLHTSDENTNSNEALASCEQVVLSVPDDETVIKRLRVAPGEGSALDDRLRFEMAHTLLDDEKDFLFDFLPVGEEGRYFGMALRNERFAQAKQLCGLNGTELQQPARFRPRSVALGLGYLNFCTREEGELCCLLDIAGCVASLCFIYDGAIAELASVSIERPDNQTDQVSEELAKDLKTVVNFQLSSMMERGIGVPLSTVILCGEDIDGPFGQALNKYFPVGITSPRLQSELLADSSQRDSIRSTDWLVALGLTVI